MPYIQRALNDLKAIEPNSDHRQVLVNILKTPMKLASVIVRLWFLLSCRKSGTVPRFIDNATSSVCKVFAGNKAIQKECQAFRAKILNESIKEAFRSKAYLERCQRRHEVELRQGDGRIFAWMKTACRNVFEDTLHSAGQRVERKFNALRTQLIPDDHHPEEGRANRSPQEPREEAPATERVTNLSSVPVPPGAMGVLSKGPKFAMTTRIRESTLREVEAGVERLAYGKRWKDFSRRNREASSTMPAPPAPPADDQADDTASSVDNAAGRGTRRFAPNFPDAAKRQPPPSTNETETELKTLKKQIMNTYKHHQQTASNTTEEERRGLKELKANESLITKPSDKCKGLVILDRESYVSKVHDILDDETNYEKLPCNPTAKIEAKTKRVFKEASRDKLPESLIRDLTPTNARTPVFYGLPKNHKTGVPLRPIVSSCGGPTEKTSWLLERILNQLLEKIPAHLRNTEEYLKRLKNKFPEHQLPPGAIVFSIDVVNLYGSIPLTEAVSAVAETIAEHEDEIDLYGLTPDDVTRLLTHCLENNTFRFDTDHYRQRLGIAMGNKAAPPVAIIFMHRFEQAALMNADLKPDFYARYIDDSIGVWTHGHDELQNFIQYLNSLHHSIKFTLEDSSASGKVAFLDTLVTVDLNSKYSTELYIKPNHSGIIIHATSAHPMATKKAVIRSEFRRASRVSSDAATSARSCDKIQQLFEANGYRKQLVRRLRREVTQPAPRRQPVDGERRERGRGATRELDGYLTLPYIDESVCAKVNSVVRKSSLNLRVAWRNNNTVRNCLVRSAYSPPQCPSGARVCNACESGLEGRCLTSGVVYKLKCVLCERKGEVVTYVGETKRPIRLRFNEHVLNAKNKTPETPIGDHFIEAHADHQTIGRDVPLSVEILQKTSDHPHRKICESLHIRQHRPLLNRNVSSWFIM